MQANHSTLPLRAFARITLETHTPLHIGSGKEAAIADAGVVTDANGLPAIPGTSLAGVLRDLARQNAMDCDSIFGSITGHGSRVSISWAHIHDANDQPVDQILDATPWPDAVLNNAIAPLLRDHVKLDHRGVAMKNAKFDELSVQVGHRFTFTLELLPARGQDRDALQAEFLQLLELSTCNSFRLGGKTRRGFGSVHVVEEQLQFRVFDLSIPSDFDDWLELPSRLDRPLPNADKWQSSLSNEVQAAQFTSIELKLKPRFFWFFGGGTESEGSDMSPVRETRITWKDGKGSVTKESWLLMPASSVKGALSHRVAFHDNRLRGHCVEETTATSGSDNPSVQLLFGFVEQRKAQRGRIIMDDCLIDPSKVKEKKINHVKIDRFTGGAWPQALFDETSLFSPDESITLHIHLDLNIEDFEQKENEWLKAMQALNRALRDLAQGHLPLGSGSGRGHGRFEATEPLRWRGPLAAQLNDSLSACFPEV